ncbi:hypothetical protein EPU41_26850, partial [Escherichia coli]
IVFWLASWMMSRWLHYPDWVTIIAQQVLMNVVSVMQADCRMNLLEIFLRWLMRKIFHVRLLPAEDALDDLIPSFLLTGQQTPAFGRRVSGVIEIADGSRRRKAAALTESDIVFWLASWMMSRWLHYPDWVTIIAQQVLMNVV